MITRGTSISGHLHLGLTMTQSQDWPRLVKVWILHKVEKRHGHDGLGAYDRLLRHCEDLGLLRISHDLGAADAAGWMGQSVEKPSRAGNFLTIGAAGWKTLAG